MLLRIVFGLFSTRERLLQKTRSGNNSFRAESAFKLVNTQTTKALNTITARSAHLQGNYPRRDKLLTSVSEQAPQERALKLITEAELIDVG